MPVIAEMSYYFHGKRVSKSHLAMLLEAEARGILDHINQGRRTIAEQWVFWRIYKRFGHPVAAFPSPSAPHIKWNRQNHALDVNAPQPVRTLAAFYRREGVPVEFNVNGEPWHMDPVNNAKLIRAGKRFAWRIHPTIRPGDKGRKVLALKRAMWKRGLRGFNRLTPGYGPKAVASIKHLQKNHHLKPDGIVGSNTWKLLR